MKTGKGFLAVALVAAGLLVSLAQAGAPMGPPSAYLGEGHWGIGGEYGRQTITMQAFGVVTEVIPGLFDDSYDQLVDIEDLTSNMFFGTIAYGIGDSWDIFARVGAADATDDIVLFDPNNPRLAGGSGGLDGGLGLAWGAGTRATFWRSGPLSVGGLAQVTWFHPGTSDFAAPGFTIPDETLTGNVDLTYWETQISLAAMYQIDTFSVWGGPLLQFVWGDLDIEADSSIGALPTGTYIASFDLDETLQVGGHFGASLKMGEALHLWGEGQITGDSWLVGIGLVFVPQGEESTEL